MSYSIICTHPRLERIDINFVRCLQCGESMISQRKEMRNKSRSDFTREQPRFTRNFDRNFSNEIIETSRPQAEPLFEYYTDKIGANRIAVDRSHIYESNPPKYRVKINGITSVMDRQSINKIIADIGAFRVDADVFGQLWRSHS